MRTYLAHGIFEGCAGIILLPLFHLGLYEKVVCRGGPLGLVFFVYTSVQPHARRRQLVYSPCLTVLVFARLVAVLVDVTRLTGEASSGIRTTRTDLS